MKESKVLLVGDNPFQGVSHLSQERAMARGNEISNPEYAAELVRISLENGADGFMLSVSEMTLSILRKLPERGDNLKLYAIVPAAYEFVRLASQLGTLGLIGHLAREIVISRNLKAVVNGIKGVIRHDPEILLRAYLLYEISRVKRAGGKANLYSLMLHEIVTDMALALNLDWLFRSYVDFLLKLKIKPGFETRNFAYLTAKFKEWGLELSKIAIAAPFNKISFQMSPSREGCEEALTGTPETEVIAINVLASGYLKPSEAIEYIRSLSQLKGIAIGVSKEKHAYDFKLFREALETRS